MKKWGLPNEGRTTIIREFMNGGRRMVKIGGKQSSQFPPAYLRRHGWIPYVVPVMATHESLGAIEIELDYYTNAVIEETEAAARKRIENVIYLIASQYITQITGNRYSTSEAIRWPKDQEAIAAGNWARFNRRSGSQLTGRQYAETRVIPKIDAGEYFMDRIIAKRTDLLLNLAATPAEDLATFDYTSVWDEETDFNPPGPLVVTPTFWQKLISQIQWWK